MLKQINIDLVQDNFNWANKDRETLSRRFYTRLFTVAPHVKMLFSGDHEKQHNMLITVMSVIVKGLDDPDKLHSYLYMLGEHHTKMGVKSEYYLIFSEVFIQTMLDLAINPKDENLEEAWRGAFDMIRNVMKKAAQDSGLELRQQAS